MAPISRHPEDMCASGAFDYDSPWKEALRLYLRSFMRLCFPVVERAIDWSRPPEFLDKELQQIVREAEAGRQFVDLLIKVWLADGTEEWILLHVEVQHRPEPGFERRLYRYNYRAMDVYGKPVATLVILADTDPAWRPARFEMVVPGTRLQFDFSVCKLLDLVKDEAGAAGKPGAFCRGGAGQLGGAAGGQGRRAAAGVEMGPDAPAL